LGISLSDDEVWEFLAEAHTGIITTLRRDGAPVSLPMWFVAFDRGVYFTTPSRSKKVERMRRDARACFVAESGHAWRELKAVVMNGALEIIEAEDVQRRVLEEMGKKYAGLGPDMTKAPEVTRKHYGSGRTTLCFTAQSFFSWDNARIRFAKATT